MTPLDSNGKANPNRHCDFAELARTISGTFALGSDSIHGPSHWRRVERNGLWLAERSGGDLLVVRLFAWFHDSCRVNEWTDPEHGKRGADYALKLRGTLFDLEDEALERLVYACTWHTDKDHSEDPTIGACWDADRLRLAWERGVDESYFSTMTGLELARSSERAGLQRLGHSPGGAYG